MFSPYRDAVEQNSGSESINSSSSTSVILDEQQQSLVPFSFSTTVQFPSSVKAFSNSEKEKNVDLLKPSYVDVILNDKFKVKDKNFSCQTLVPFVQSSYIQKSTDFNSPIDSVGTALDFDMKNFIQPVQCLPSKSSKLSKALNKQLNSSFDNNQFQSQQSLCKKNKFCSSSLNYIDPVLDTSSSAKINCFRVCQKPNSLKIKMKNSGFSSELEVFRMSSLKSSQNMSEVLNFSELNQNAESIKNDITKLLNNKSINESVLLRSSSTVDINNEGNISVNNLLLKSAPSIVRNRSLSFLETIADTTHNNFKIKFVFCIFNRI